MDIVVLRSISLLLSPLDSNKSSSLELLKRNFDRCVVFIKFEELGGVKIGLSDRVAVLIKSSSGASATVAVHEWVSF